MTRALFETIAEYRQTWTTGAVTTIAAGTGSAGHLFAKRWNQQPALSGFHYRLKRLEVEFILTTAFGAAQEVGYDFFKLTGYSAFHTAGVQVTIGANAKKLARYDNSRLNDQVRIANAAALTAGTHNLDGEAFARGSQWMGAVGAELRDVFDFTDTDLGGIILSPGAAAANAEGILMRNTILMGAAGVGKWHITTDWDEGLLTGV